jgi:hypothetical protein
LSCEYATAGRCVRRAPLLPHWGFCLPVSQAGLIDGGINCATESDGQIVDAETWSVRVHPYKQRPSSCLTNANRKKKKRLSNDEVTCFGKGRKTLGRNALRNYFILFLSSLGSNISAIALIISD